mgnify:FL=1
MKNTYKYRLLSRINLEALSPLVIGSGNKNIKTDTVVAKDVNELPYIPATTLAGLIRHSLPEEEQRRWMGYQTKEESYGSQLILSEAKILSEDGKPIDGLSNKEDAVKLLCYQLPIRQHVRINHQGVAEKNGKFDEEIVPKGMRFCFEMELMSEEDDNEIMDKILSTIQSNGFRIGSGSRSGFGQISIVSILHKKLDLSTPEDLKLYLSKSSSLENIWKGFEPYTPAVNTNTDYISYELTLQPTDFMFFGAGFGNECSDMTFVREPVIQWDNDDRASIIEKEKVVLIPGSSVKGALAHRTAYHYNKLKGCFADGKSAEELQEHVGKQNDAVKLLFGSEGDKRGKDKKRGNILISDVIQIQTKELEKKVLNHVKIDRFTGGAVTGALFSEEVLYAPKVSFTLEILLDKAAITELKENKEDKENNVDKNKALEAFETALTDLCKGYLPLGGGVNRGNGTFKGSLKKNGETIYE